MKCPKCHSDNTDTARFCSNCAASLTAAEEVRPSFTRTLETPVQELNRGTLFADRYEIIEELGDTTKAIEQFEKFLDLWKDADPGITEVDDARERRDLKSLSKRHSVSRDRWPY